MHSSVSLACNQVKCVPFLEPSIPTVKCDCFTAEDVMTRPVATLSIRTRVRVTGQSCLF